MATEGVFESANDTRNPGRSEKLSSPSETAKLGITEISHSTYDVSDVNTQENHAHYTSLETDKSNTDASSLHAIPEQRQMIAVSAQKNPSAFFNLARRFLVSDEYVDISALEGAIVSAVDTAHLLERAKLATIVRIQTSYVAVEPKVRLPGIAETNEQMRLGCNSPHVGTSPIDSSNLDPSLKHQSNSYNPHHGRRIQTQGKPSNPLRRSRISITVKRTENYRLWLEKNQTDLEEDDDDEHDIP